MTDCQSWLYVKPPQGFTSPLQANPLNAAILLKWTAKLQSITNASGTGPWDCQRIQTFALNGQKKRKKEKQDQCGDFYHSWIVIPCFNSTPTVSPTRHWFLSVVWSNILIMSPLCCPCLLWFRTKPLAKVIWSSFFGCSFSSEPLFDWWFALFVLFKMVR